MVRKTFNRKTQWNKKGIEKRRRRSIILDLNHSNLNHSIYNNHGTIRYKEIPE